ncbi:hypothetical protein ACIPQ3_30725 [Streptomyces albidoflavus]
MTAADRLRPAADRVARGAAVLGPSLAGRVTRRVVAWVRRGHRADLTGLAAHLGTIVRAVIVALVLAALAQLVRAVPGLMWVIVFIGLVAVWRAGASVAIEEAVEEEDQEDQEEDQEEAPADLLARHVLGQLAELEAAGRRGVHVTALISSAEEAGLLPIGAMDKTAMRAWLPASGIPVTKSVKVRGDVDFGLSIAHVTKALGMSPGEALRRLSGEAPETPVEAPSGEAPETPVEGAPEAPAPAPVEALPPARLALVKPLPEEEAESGARGAA